MTFSTAVPWNDLLDFASEGGLEPLVTIGGTGHGTLAFQVWLHGATPAGLEAANLATKLFDSGGTATNEIFEHCLHLGCVYREFADRERISFKGPLTGALPSIINGWGERE